ncbi:MAG: agmatinase family protein [Bdellovibrionales bacterium]|nr:agmatinase family protein [Bdellovibrionales bacterium]
MSDFDPSGTASYSVGLFGIPSERETARVVLIPVPWEVTTSYGSGAAMGPEAVLKASPQIDLFDLELGKAYESGYHLLAIPEEIAELNAQLKPKALEVRTHLEDHGHLNHEMQRTLAEINTGCSRMSEWVYMQAKDILKRGQIPAVLGGDHSSPEGNIRAVSEATSGKVGVLHVDAHADLRFQYQGFQRSHASIMNNVMNAPWRPSKLVQVAIRDFSQEEFAQIEERGDIETFFDLNLKREMFEGRTWADICKDIAAQLPEQIYISFDIDGLSPEYCPHTGTPVPGGLTFDQANYLMRHLVKSGKKIIGFDLNEVAPGESDEWDGNVGARLLYKMCGWAVHSQPRI